MKFGYFSALHDFDLEKGFSVVRHDFLTELAFVEELGFEGVWTGEHHLGPEGFSNCPNPILLSAHIASMTGLKSIGLSCVSARAGHGDPDTVRIRGDAEISRSRVTVGDPRAVRIDLPDTASRRCSASDR
ncbi:MAG: LLM class flavin-dependent oxidoreductase [Thiotrichales bacterium]|nr:LLM class flavin-dependent oxidoreductase [Thiotrichales bacterium]